MDRRPPPGTARQRGLGLIETLFITLLVGGALVAGTLWLQIHTASGQVREQVSVLQRADRALIGFATARYRLPCPDTNADGNRDGREDCGTGASKGRLPWRDLGIEDPALRARIRQLVYIVDTAGADLTDVSNGYFEPRTWQGFSADPEDTQDFRGFGYAGTPDLCAALGDADNSSGARLETPGGAVSAYPAYALAHPGTLDADGDDSLFDGNNTAAATVLASASRATSADYDDRVRRRGHTSLFQSLDCSRLMLSLDGISLGVGAMEEVQGMKDQLVVNAAIATAFNISSLGFAIHDTVMSGITLGAAITELSLASAALSAAIGSCVVLVGCAEIPHAAAWVAAAATAVAASGVAMPLHVAAVASQGSALGMTISAAILAGYDVPDTEVNLDRARDAIKDSIEESKDERDKLDVGEFRENFEEEEEDLNAARSDMYAEAESIIEKVNNQKGGGYLDETALDDDLTQVENAAEDWIQAEQDVNEAKEALDRAKERASQTENTGDGNSAVSGALDELNKQIDQETDPEKRQDLIDAREAIKEQMSQNSGNQVEKLRQQKQNLEEQIDNLNSQISKIENEGGDASELKKQRNALEDKKDLIDDQIVAIGGQGSVEAMQTALNNAKAQRDNAKTEYENAVDDALYQVEELDACVRNDDGTRDCSAYDVGRDKGYDDDLFWKIAAYEEQLSEYWGAKIEYEQAKEKKQALDERIQDARNTLNDLQSMDDQEGGSGSGPAVWDGAATILERASEKGGTE